MSKNDKYNKLQIKQEAKLSLG